MHDDANIKDSVAPLIEHLAELRTRLIYSLLTFIISMMSCFYFAPYVLDFLLQPIARILLSYGQDAQFITTSAQENFFVYFRIAMLMGLGLSFPMIAYQLWRFVAPGLYRQEKAAFIPFIIASPLLFLAGAAFAYYIVTPLAMNFFLSFSDFLPEAASIATGEKIDAAALSTNIENKILPKVSEILDLELKFIFAFGLCFQLPVLLTLLGLADLISGQGLKDMRKYAIVSILILAAIVTPPDVVTQLILFSVVYMLYEVSIHLVIFVQRRKEQRLRADGYYDGGIMDDKK